MHATIQSRISAAGALALLVFASTVARAADPSPEVMQKSSELYNQARALQVRGKWAEAEATYQAAWNLRKTFDIAGNLGDSELHVGQPREAAEHISYALRNVPAGVTAEQTEALKKLLGAAQQQIGTLRVSLTVTGAQLFVDGRPLDDSPGEVFVDPGPHTIEARLAGYDPVQKTITARAGASERVELALVSNKRSVVPAIVMGGLGAVALASGIGVLVASGSKASSVRAQHDAIVKAGRSCVTGASNFDARCTGLQSTASAGDTLHNAGVGLLIGAGAAAAGAVVYLVWPESGAAASRAGTARLTPLVTPDHAGLVFSGTF